MNYKSMVPINTAENGDVYEFPNLAHSVSPLRSVIDLRRTQLGHLVDTQPSNSKLAPTCRQSVSGQSGKLGKFIPYLMAGFFEVLRIKRHTESEFNSWSEKNVIRKCCDSSIVYFGLSSAYGLILLVSLGTLINSAYLGERGWVQAIFARNLQPHGIACFRVPSCLRTGLHL